MKKFADFVKNYWIWLFGVVVIALYAVLGVSIIRSEKETVSSSASSDSTGLVAMSDGVPQKRVVNTVDTTTNRGITLTQNASYYVASGTASGGTAQIQLVQGSARDMFFSFYIPSSKSYYSKPYRFLVTDTTGDPWVNVFDFTFTDADFDVIHNFDIPNVNKHTYQLYVQFENGKTVEYSCYFYFGSKLWTQEYEAYVTRVALQHEYREFFTGSPTVRLNHSMYPTADSFDPEFNKTLDAYYNAGRIEKWHSSNSIDFSNFMYVAMDKYPNVVWNDLSKVSFTITFTRKDTSGDIVNNASYDFSSSYFVARNFSNIKNFNHTVFVNDSWDISKMVNAELVFDNNITYPMGDYLPSGTYVSFDIGAYMLVGNGLNSTGTVPSGKPTISIYDVQGADGYYSSGYDEGYNKGVLAGRDGGYIDGKRDGYAEGLADGSESGMNLVTLMWTVIDEPFAIVYRLLNFEILGVNVFGFVMGLVTLGLVGVVLKLVL